VDYQTVSKTKTETDSGTGKERRISEKSKNEMMREMTERTVNKHVKFGYILADSWFAPAENMRFIEKKGKTFIFEINDNRLVAASGQGRKKGHFARTDRMEIPDGEPAPVYLKDLQFPAIELFRNFSF
jgi:SRSO17 transposase